MLELIKRRAYEVLEKPEHETSIFRYVTFFIVALVILNVAVVILETEKDLSATFGRAFILFDAFSAIVFTVEYLVRLWVCTEDPKYASPVRGRLRYAVSGMAIIDLIAILPFYLMFLPPMRVVRLVRIARVLRLLKLVRYSDATVTMARVLHNKKEELIITLGIGVTLIIISSTLVYYAESEVQPEKFSSILTSMWWAIITLATVGYGDVYPVTTLGRIFGALTALFGIGLFALPTALIGAGFIQELQKEREGKVACPHCGKDIHEKSEIEEEEELYTFAVEMHR